MYNYIHKWGVADVWITHRYHSRVLMACPYSVQYRDYAWQEVTSITPHSVAQRVTPFGAERRVTPFSVSHSITGDSVWGGRQHESESTVCVSVTEPGL